MKSDVKKVLLISNSLQKAGSEKYTFELAKHFDKSRFDVEVLTTVSVHTEKEHPHFYYDELLKLGIKVHTLLHTFNTIYFNTTWLKFFPFAKKLVDYSFYKLNKFRAFLKYERKLKDLFNQFDAVILIDALYYKDFKHILPRNIYIETHLMCHQAQFDNILAIYSAYSNSGTHNFVYIDDYQLKEAKAQQVSIGNTFYFPLSMDFDDIKVHMPENGQDEQNVIEIGLFSRINRIKPINLMLDAFEALLQLNKQVRLNIFGMIQDQGYYEELISLIQSKKLQHAIVFHGHSNNMMHSIHKHNISLLWVVSIYEFVGYAAIELCLNNVPLILNNIDKNEAFKLKDNKESIPPYFYTFQELARYTNEIILNNGLAELAGKERARCLQNNNIKINIEKYQQYLMSSIENVQM